MIYLDKNNKEDFRKFVNDEVSFNPHNMFICKSKNLLISYYSDVFPWLENCEKLFGFKDLKGYGLTRIYGFLLKDLCLIGLKKTLTIKNSNSISRHKRYLNN